MATADLGNLAGHIDEGGIEDHKDRQSTPASLIKTSSSAARSRARSFSSITDNNNDLSVLAQYARPSVGISAPSNEVRLGRAARVGAPEAETEDMDTRGGEARRGGFAG
ncbi:hypothetical protein GALMADRAFT_147372 [Galerina marginata CBS 339.88]|uniref:Uncharacterized protein n=1 Tax=Galerina marginata (strain CBS 339.88) TaxID=685588 RepID=A0A067S8L6_GALM3|nr:hypothetical protein GALMADRAFT_147372 [Galerina marginata CBS 339.88]